MAELTQREHWDIYEPARKAGVWLLGVRAQVGMTGLYDRNGNVMTPDESRRAINGYMAEWLLEHGLAVKSTATVSGEITVCVQHNSLIKTTIRDNFILYLTYPTYTEALARAVLAVLKEMNDD